MNMSVLTAHLIVKTLKSTDPCALLCVYDPYCNVLLQQAVHKCRSNYSERESIPAIRATLPTLLSPSLTQNITHSYPEKHTLPK